MADKTNLIATGVNAENLPVIQWRSVRVVATEILAVGYGTDEANIRKNLSRNPDRFEEGKHYFLLTGSDLREFKRLVTDSHLVNKHTSQLILWTDRGAARMSKIVDTDEAWTFYEKMEQAYFRKPAPVDAMKLLNDPSTLRGLLMNYSEDNERLTGENQILSATVNSLEKHFTRGMSIPAFCKGLNGVNINKMSWWAFQRKWLYNEQHDPEKNPKWRVASYARDKYLTEDETKITPLGEEPFSRFTPVLTERGCHRLYQLYMKGELPMKKTWNGEYYHDKAIYTLEKK